MPFGRWGEIFSNEIVVAAMIDRLVHHAEDATLAGDSCRTRSCPEMLEQQPRQGANYTENQPEGSEFRRRSRASFHPTLRALDGPRLVAITGARKNSGGFVPDIVAAACTTAKCPPERLPEKR